MIKAFLGQMTYALAYLHKDNIAHRNIKPSNIQLSGQSTFVLFDFEPATITRDRARVKQRLKKNLKRWLAPESLSLNQWTEMSDIWSLGCVVLDMVTCHLLNMDSSVTQLLRLHQDQTPLKVITHSGLNQVLTKMFRCHPNKRANIWELVEESLVKSCLQHCGIPIRTIERMVPSGVHEPPLHQGFDNSLEFMERYGNVESVQLSVLAFLLSDQNNMLAESGDISSLCSRTLVREIRRTIQNFPRHTQLLARAFLLLSCLAPHELAAFRLLLAPDGGRGLGLIKEVKLHHHDNPEVIGGMCGLLRAMAQYDSVVSEMVSDQIPEELQEIVLQFEANEEVVLLARQALGKLKDSQ
ncbi:serine/threonine kinase-like domain-containing protein STKLD1 [Osmerus mordax]|uniref:serine/threonine kinase-like domain-containing protein STKLD1 n=1 Tax=Osmerus mordax TaxID=8014 RepID=UPI00351026F9